MKLILSSTDYQSLISCLRSYRGAETLGEVYIYFLNDRYYCVLDKSTIFDFGVTDNVDVIPPFSQLEFFAKHV